MDGLYGKLGTYLLDDETSVRSDAFVPQAAHRYDASCFSNGTWMDHGTFQNSMTVGAGNVTLVNDATSGLPAVRIEDDEMGYHGYLAQKSSSALAGNTAVTVVAVAKVIGDLNHEAILSQAPEFGDSILFGVNRPGELAGASMDAVQMFVASTEPGGIVSNVINRSRQNFAVYTWRLPPWVNHKSDATSLMKKDGETLGWQPYGADPAATGIKPHPARIGSADESSANNDLNWQKISTEFVANKHTVVSEIAEVLVWNKALTDAEVEQVERCLCSKYQITGACSAGSTSSCWAPVVCRNASQGGLGVDMGRSCVTCGEGLVCLAASDEPQQAAGYKVNVLGRWEYSIYLCPHGPAACPAGPLGQCGGDALGVMCVECPREPVWTSWHDDVGRCVPCKDESVGSAWVVPVVATVVLAAMCVLYRNSLPVPGRQELPMAMEVAVSLAQLLVLVQMGSVLGELEIPWGHPIEDILGFLRLFVLDLKFLHLDCVAGLTYAERFVVGSTMPLILILIYGLAALVLMRCIGVRDAGLRCVNASGMAMHCFFIGLIFHATEAFLGFQHPNGQWSMRAGPEVLFGSDTHNGLVACAVAHFVFYGGGFTSLCALASYHMHHRKRSQKAGALALRWSYFLYWKFRPECYFWGMALLLRSLFFCLIPVVGSRSPYVQLILMQFILVTFIFLHGYFWPYRTLLHNIADLFCP